jgi:uncharacterized protein (TIGR02147 family)
MKTVFEYKQLPEYLKDVLAHRTEKNSSYSMRAFAKALDIDQSTLSRFINGKRKGSLRLVEKLCENLMLTLDETSYFKDQFKRQYKESANEEGAQEYQKIDTDNFEYFSSWFYLPILQLIRLDNFVPDNKWISDILGVKKEKVDEAIERLQRLGLLKIENGKWYDTSSGFITTLEKGKTSSALKNNQKQLREKAIDALYNIDISQRDHSSIVIPCKKSDMPEIKKRITEFRRDLAKYLERHEDPEDLYQLTVSFFPLLNDPEDI